jgi:hypothetical protein
MLTELVLGGPGVDMLGTEDHHPRSPAGVGIALPTDY